MGAQAVEIGASRLLHTNWIISEKQDLTWFIGSSLAGYLALALMAAGFPLTPLFLVWLIGVDGPHVLATFTRTYFDKTERKKLGLLLLVIFPAMLVGPLAVTRDMNRCSISLPSVGCTSTSRNNTSAS